MCDHPGFRKSGEDSSAAALGRSESSAKLPSLALTAGRKGLLVSLKGWLKTGLAFLRSRQPPNPCKPAP